MKRARRSDHLEQVEALLREAADLPHGPTRIGLCEEATRIADLHGDPALAFRARQELVDAACFGGRPDLLIVAYAWCLSWFDRGEHDRLSPYALLWRMKWVVNALPRFPEVELPAIHRMLDDMERRYREFGGSVQPVVGVRRSVALKTGHLAEAARAHNRFVRMPRTTLSDCRACEAASLADYHVVRGRNAVGVRKAEELIASGLKCAKVPQETYGDILIPMVKLRRAPDAMRYHKTGYRMVRREAGEVQRWGQHMAYLALTGNDARAAKLLEAHLADVEASSDLLSVLDFFRNTFVVLELLADRKEKLRLRLPPGSPFANPTGEYILADLALRVRDRAAELSRRFDERNGNSYYSDLLEEAATLRKWATPVSYG
ncbi:MAG: hypothetical protein J2P46_03175 [Zavarzinella sp.]|nr:hypothetical protein [Zavarzinella sp.]